MSIKSTYSSYTITTAGGTITYDVNSGPNMYNLLPAGGSTLLFTNLTIDPTGVPEEGAIMIFNYGGNVGYDGGTITIFSRLLASAEALKPYTIKCTYINATWVVMLEYSDLSSISGVTIADNTITGSTKLIAGTVSLAKLVVGAARGYFMRTGVGGVWEAANGITSGNLLMGNGTDVISQAVTGDVTISGAGVTAIGAGKITAEMLAYTPMEYFQAELSITSAQILALNSTPLTIVAAPGAGYYIEVISATSQMTFVAAAYAANTTIQLINSGSTIAQLQDTAILLSTINKKTKFKDVTSAAAGETQILENTALTIKALTGNPTTGDSAIKVIVTYKITAI